MDQRTDVAMRGEITVEQLEQDFLFYLTNAKYCLRRLPRDKRRHGEKWLMSLITRRPGTLKDQMQRNMHISDLLGEMMMGNITGVYAGQPPRPDQPLPPYREEILPCQPPEHPAWLRDILGKGEEPKEVRSQQDTIQHRSKDGKTYVASKELPNGRGAMGFVALSMDDKDSGEGENIQERRETRTVREFIWQKDETGKWKKS